LIDGPTLLRVTPTTFRRCWIAVPGSACCELERPPAAGGSTMPFDAWVNGIQIEVEVDVADLFAERLEPAKIVGATSHEPVNTSGEFRVSRHRCGDGEDPV
jgi:hypothetical protein